MRVLVTGGAGFIGSHVVDRYLEAGWEVTVLDDLSSGRRENVPAGVRLVVGDVAGRGLEELLAGVEFDLVNHHAAQIDVRVSVQDPARDAHVNLIGLLSVVELVRARGGRPLLFASSGGVPYGEADVVPTPESAPKRPESPYGVAKLASEFYLQYYDLIHGIPYLALRYGNVYGPRQNPEGEAGVVSIFSRNILRGAPLTVFGTGEQERDFVYVKDVAEANWLASLELLERETAGSGGARLGGARAGRNESDRDSGSNGDPVDARALNVATGRGTSVRQLVQALGEIVGSELAVRQGAARPGEIQRSVLDCSKIERRLGWRARTAFAEGLDATYRYIASHAGAFA